MIPSYSRITLAGLSRLLPNIIVCQVNSLFNFVFRRQLFDCLEGSCLKLCNQRIVNIAKHLYLNTEV